MRGVSDKHQFRAIYEAHHAAVCAYFARRAARDDVVGVQLLLEGADRVAIHVGLEAHSKMLGGRAESALLVTSIPISRP